MVKPPDSTTEQSKNVEEEIFKTLSHEIRRNIIKMLGDQKGLTFTEIKNNIGTVESSSLSYHLKNMKPLIDQKDLLYKLRVF